MVLAEFPRYARYLDTKADWAGSLPTEWDVEKAKWLFRRAERPVRSDDEIVTCFRDGQVTLRSKRRTEGFTNALKEHGYQRIHEGDLVIHAMDAFAGAIGVSDSTGKSTPVYSACVPRRQEAVNPYFYAYYMRSLALSGYLTSLAKGIRERSTDFRFADFANLVLAVPSLKTQDAIVCFLDQKTAKVDEAIAIEERQIALFKERKQIVIQNAVTKGLNPSAPMKGSGVDWIGEIPDHWQVKKLKYVLEERNERSETGSEPLLMMSQTHGLVVRSEHHEKAEVAQSNVENKIVHNGDLVFNKLKAHLGVFFKSDVPFKGIVSPDYAVYKSHRYVNDLKFFELLFRSSHYLEQFIARSTGIVQGLIRLYTSELFDIYVPIPPPEEQISILAEVRQVQSQHDATIELKVRQIASLKEYKAALINSAVTGKIKVA